LFFPENISSDLVGRKQSILHYHETFSEALEGTELDFSSNAIEFKDPVPTETVNCIVELTEEKTFVCGESNRYSNYRWFLAVF
jgi:hypothetical protein